MNILIDTTLSPRIARALDTLLTPAHHVTHLGDLANGCSTDRQMMDFLQSADHAVVMGIDLDITDHPHRMAALREWGRPVFLLAGDWLDLPPDESAWKLMGMMPQLLKKLSRDLKPAIYLVPSTPRARIRKLA